jgi:hypothetical protein
MQWLLGGRSDVIAETVRRKACVEGWEQCEKGINQSLFLKRLTEAICRESQKSRLTKLHKITDSKFIYLLQLNREIRSLYIIIPAEPTSFARNGRTIAELK